MNNSYVSHLCSWFYSSLINVQYEVTICLFFGTPSPSEINKETSAFLKNPYYKQLENDSKAVN